MSKTAKIAWVDVSKGIVICLMVIGHSSLPAVLNRWIWSFHMPFFFIISALFTNWNKGTISEFIIRKVKILMLPFIAYSAINIVIIPSISAIPIADFVLSVLKNGWGGIALWFIPVFTLSLIICRLTPDGWLPLCGLTALAVGSVLAQEAIIIPWTLSSVPFGVAIMMFTRYFQQVLRDWITLMTATISRGLIVVGIGIAASVFISHFYRLDMCSNIILPVAPICTGIIGGTMCIVGLSLLITSYLPSISRLFTHIGHNTYEVMALSQVSIMVANIYIPQLVLLKYSLMIVILIIAVYLRKLIEGHFANTEAI